MRKIPRKVLRWRVPLAILAAIATMAGSVVWLERGQGVDSTPAGYRWGEAPDDDAARAGAAHASTLEQETMVLVLGGEYVIGDEGPSAQKDAPMRRVRLDSFYIDRHEVTNRQFAEFVAATKYVTTAEREGGGWLYRGGEKDWAYVKGANWRHPLGPGSSIQKAMEHPVVMVAWADANAYAKWAGKRLPTEAEWEVAARGATSASAAQTHRNPSQDGSANVWQGTWPQRNEMQDGHFYTAPAGSFTPNALGLHDMIGNVWEWTADWYAPGKTRVARGGSWFCSSNYCGAYRPGFRGKSPPGNAFNNTGFRCARSLTAKEKQKHLAQAPAPEVEKP